MTFRQITITIILSAVPCSGTAEGIITDPTACDDSLTSAVGKIACLRGLRMEFLSAATRNNPAAMPFRQPFTTTTLSLDGELSSTDRTLPAESGDGCLTGSVAAKSYRHLGLNTTVWGDARFMAGKIRDVVWNNSADYELVGPYVIGDPVGEDLTHRSYDFGGGYAGISGRWSWGAHASYRASIDHRGRDPRDKIVVSDLKVEAGGSFRPGPHPFAIGLSGKAGIYNQTADIDFYSPINDIPTYAMTGLGAFYPRFSGNSVSMTAYLGTGFGASASLFPVRDTRIQIRAEIDFDLVNLRQFLRDFNNLELTRTSTLDLGMEYGILLGGTSLRYGFTLDGRLRRKTGTENLLGPSTGNTYPKIGERDNYHSSRLHVSLSIPGEYTPSPSDRLTATLRTTFSTVSEKLSEPWRKVAARSISPSLHAGWEHRFQRETILTVSARMSHRFTTPEEVSTEGIDPSVNGLREATERNAALLTSDVTGYGFFARLDIPVEASISLFIKAGWDRFDFSRRCGSADRISISAGINL